MPRAPTARSKLWANMTPLRRHTFTPKLGLDQEQLEYIGRLWPSLALAGLIAFHLFINIVWFQRNRVPPWWDQ